MVEPEFEPISLDFKTSVIFYYTVVSLSEKLGDAHNWHNIVLQIAILHISLLNKQVATF